MQFKVVCDSKLRLHVYKITCNSKLYEKVDTILHSLQFLRKIAMRDAHCSFINL